MTKTVAILNQKGGVGKTSICMNIAGVLAERGRAVLVIDADPQQSAAKWAAQREGEGLPVQPLDLDGGARKFQDAVARLTNETKAEVVLIDCPPELRETTMVAALIADLVLIPCTASALDIWAARAAVEIVHDARKLRKGRRPDAALVPSKLVAGTSLARQLAVVLQDLNEAVSPAVYQRVAVAEAAIIGMTIVEYAPRSRAAYEFTELAEYVIGRIRNGETTVGQARRRTERRRPGTKTARQGRKRTKPRAR